MSIKDNLNYFQLKRNFIFNIISFALTVGLGFYLVPFIVNKIGVVAYSYIPIAMLVFDYMSIIIGSTNTSISRHLAISLSSNDYESTRDIYSNSFLLVLVLEGLLFPLLLYITLFPSSIVTIEDPSLMNQIQWLFGFTFLGNLLSFFNGVIGAPLYAHNRIDLGRKRDMIRISVRAIIIIVGLSFSNSLMIVGLGNLFAGLSSLSFTYFHKTKLTPFLKLNYNISKEILTTLFKTIFWIMISQLGFLLFNKVELLIINRFISPEEAGKFSLILPWVNVLITIGSLITVLFGPTIVYLSAKSKFEELKIKLEQITKIIAIVVGGVTTIMMCFSSEILYLWLGKKYEDLDIILSIVAFSTALVMVARISSSVFQAFDHVKYPGLFTLLFGMLNVISMVIATYYFHYGIIAIAIIGGFFIILLNCIIFPILLDITLRGSKTILFFNLLRIILFILIPFLMDTFVLKYYNFSLELRLAIICFISLIIISFQVSKNEILNIVEISKTERKN